MHFSSIAQQLGYFKSPLESGLKVANMGKKTFRYTDENPGRRRKLCSTIRPVPTAQDLLDRFEHIGASERAYSDLNRTAKFDKLGVNDSLAEIESLWLKKQLAAPLAVHPAARPYRFP